METATQSSFSLPEAFRFGPVGPQKKQNLEISEKRKALLDKITYWEH